MATEKETPKKKYVFIRLKDRQSSGGQSVGNTHFNNATVECYVEGAIPAAVLIGVKNHLFEYCKEKDYETWIKAQEEQADFFKRVQAQRNANKKASVLLMKDNSIEETKVKEEKEKKGTAKSKGGEKESEEKGEDTTK
jgi:hypothetical protein